ncbi:8-oxo-dGTP pyrophosphatase MutT (NUDIX family) [Arcticibacter pallidicorallinus]|uniref:GDP-mannose pyrophosphatase n=1 Tax=Arcticibacter pallidicorallinus TaxID=1259464 RepID=A0A2T0TU40_9SPHI|nr:NUDIX hydrolase [Arcticibacter pallidicorallinus]PRY49177.1 8-oxo-dGTP pyrophosphatase MutT (NUDIX family) [Arcticibacter pallidicorallinus]
MINEDKNPWQILSQKEIYTNPWINVTEFNVINPSGGKGIYGKVHFQNYALAIIALDEQQHIWLVGQYRFPINQYSWELPEGGGPLHLSPLESAQRELMEETGLTAESWTELQHIHLSNSVSDELGIIYLARNLSMGQAEPEETEELQLKRIPFEDAYQMVINNQITDSMSIAAILRLKILLLENQL